MIALIQFDLFLALFAALPSALCAVNFGTYTALVDPIIRQCCQTAVFANTDGQRW